jgi:hypothetical protein
MNAARHKEIMAHADIQFAPQWGVMREGHGAELREAQFRARKTNNAAAMLPAEAACYVNHVKALVIAKARCIAAAYTAFNEPVGSDAEAELTSFFSITAATRRSCFKAEVELQQVRTRRSLNSTQLTALLRGFEHNAHPALLEGRAILNKQRVETLNRPHAAAIATKYVVDTCVFNWLADGLINSEALPSDGGFAITHIQVDEINKTKDEDRRAKLILVQVSLHCKLLPTESFLLDVSRLDHAKLGDGQLFTSIKTELDKLNRAKKNNNRDALIAEAAVQNGLTLITADEDLKSVTEQHSGKVIFFSKLRS